MILMMAVLNPTQEERRAKGREGNTSEWLIRLITWQECVRSPPPLQYCDCGDVVQWSSIKRLGRPKTTLRDKIKNPKTKEQRDCLSTPPGGNWDTVSLLSRKRENKTDRLVLLFKHGWYNFVSPQMVSQRNIQKQRDIFWNLTLKVYFNDSSAATFILVTCAHL